MIWIVSWGLYVINNIATEWFNDLEIFRPLFLGFALVGLGFGLSSVVLRRELKK